MQLLFITCAMEVTFSSVIICLFVSRIMQKLFHRYLQNLLAHRPQKKRLDFVDNANHVVLELGLHLVGLHRTLHGPICVIWHLF